MGSIKGVDNNNIEFIVVPFNFKVGDSPIFDTISCSNDKFSYEIDLEKYPWFQVEIVSDSFREIFSEEEKKIKNLRNIDIVFLVSPGDNIKIDATIGDYGIFYTVEGNNIGDQMSKVNMEEYNLNVKYNKVLIEQEEAEAPEHKRSLDLKKKQIQNTIDSMVLSKIKTHPDWEYSALLLTRQPIDTMAKYLYTLNSSVKNSPLSEHVKKAIKTSVKGMIAPDFSLIDNYNKEVSLSDFKGSYVVLDFWGTWCGVCLREMHNLKAINEKYKENVKVISICCHDDNKKQWLDAIQNYEMNWINLFASTDDVIKKYGVAVYPTIVLIDKEGNILMKDHVNYEGLSERLAGLIKTTANK